MILLLSTAAVATACPRTRDVQKSQTRVDLAKDLLSKGEDVPAEGELKKALGFDPENEEAYNVWGLVYVIRASRNQRLIEYDNCLDGVEAEGLRNEIDSLMRKAEDRFKKAVVLAPDFGDAWQNRAVVALHFRDWDKAVEYETKALENLGRLPLPAEMLARANLAWAHYQKQEYGKAATELLQALQRDPNFCLGSYRLAAVLFEREQYEDARERLMAFLPAPGQEALCQPVLEALYLAGQTALRLRDVETAQTAFNMCVEAAPKACLAEQCQKAAAELAP